MLQRMTHASERGAAARESRRGSRIAAIEKFVGSVRFHTHVQHVLSDDRLSFGSEARFGDPSASAVTPPSTRDGVGKATVYAEIGRAGPCKRAIPKI